jgi:SAM-dependent methyltransferase
MEASHLDELIELEDSYWWHVAKRQLAIDLLQRYFPPPGMLVEGGIGSSRNLVEFKKLGYDVAGLDIMSEAVEHGRERGIENVRLHDLSEPWPFASESVKVVVLLDVLEHLADPVHVLKNVREILTPGGGMIITVPAYPCLYGDWDKRLGHYRRYTADALREHVLQAGLKVTRLTHWNSFTTPAAVCVRGYQRCFPNNRPTEFPRVSRLTNQMLLAAANLERYWLRKLPAPFGLSLLGVLHK